jgi:hypothetical protein
MKMWNPKVSSCSKCSYLKPIKDRKTKHVDWEKKLCEKFGWEIMNNLAEKQVICRIEKPKRRKQR